MAAPHTKVDPSEWKKGGKHWAHSMANPEHRARCEASRAERRQELQDKKRLAAKDVEGYARGTAVEAIDFLSDVFTDDSQEMKYRIMAATQLLDRGLGKAKSTSSIKLSATPTTNGKLPPPTTAELELMVQQKRIEEKVVN